MAFPRDAAQQQEYLVARSAEALATRESERVRGLFEESGGLGGVAHARSISTLFALTQDAVLGWFVASLMMSLLVRLAIGEQVVSDQASVNKAAYMLEKQRPLFKNPDALEALPRNRSDIVSVWSKYRPVAHFCASFVIWSNRVGDDFADLVYNDLPIVLAGAKWFQEWGLEFKPARTKRTVLDRETCWLLPNEFASGPAAFAPLTAGEVELLKAYRAPIPSQ